MIEHRKPSPFLRSFQVLAFALSAGFSVPALSQAYTIESFPVRPNLTEEGWALYSQTAGFQSKVSLMRVGKKEKIGKKKARWLNEQTLEPQLGVVTMDYLVEEKKSMLTGVLKSVLTFPGGTPTNLKDLTTDISNSAANQANQTEETLSDAEAEMRFRDFERGLRCDLVEPFLVGNRQVKTFRVQVPPDSTFLWSPEVPGFGIVQERGKTTTTLIDFGVGDPPDLQQLDQILSGVAVAPTPTPQTAEASSQQPSITSPPAPLAAPNGRTPLPILPAEKKIFDNQAACTAE